MIGRVVRISNNLVSINVEDEVINVYAEEYTDVKVGDLVSTYTTITKLANSNMYHEYPEGTIGEVV